MSEPALKQRERRQRHAQDAQDAYTAALAEIRAKGPIAFMESLIIPAGNVRAGSRMKLGDWQKTFICNALKPSTKTSVLVTARKNSKSFTCAAIGLWHALETDANRVIVASLTIEHSQEIFRFIRTLCETNEIEVSITTSPRPHVPETSRFRMVARLCLSPVIRSVPRFPVKPRWFWQTNAEYGPI